MVVGSDPLRKTGESYMVVPKNSHGRSDLFGSSGVIVLFMRLLF